MDGVSYPRRRTRASDRIVRAMASASDRREPVQLDGRPLSIEDVVGVARGGRTAVLAPTARTAMDAARAALERRAAGDEALYGINTGFGSLSRVRIPAGELAALQVNLVRSHAAGVGDPLDREVVRAMMLVLAASLARGRSAVRPAVVELVLAMLAADVVPVIPSRGSVGASGDLAPLAHLALVLIGEGEAWHAGTRRPGNEALRAAGLAPVALAAKEGLALINGTHLMCAVGALAMHDIARLVHAATGATAMAIDACRATDAFLDTRIHAARNQPGQMAVAEELRALLAGSQVLAAHRENDPRVQDPYSFRCAPQVLGAARDVLGFARSVVERELGGVTDNPLVFADGGATDIVSGGNFHGMPLALALDAAKMALVPMAAISERRTFWILSGHDAHNPVKPYLAGNPGTESGLMIAQYAAAACCNELQVLAHPASAHNVPTSAGIEDINSMGATSANHLRAAVRLATDVIAIELLVMAEGLEAQRPLRSGAGVEALHAEVRARVPRLAGDRPPAGDIAAVGAAIRGD
jgi:histidine ammonia-lyase